jgi:hypothetical protein
MQSENTADLAAALAKAQSAMEAAKFDKTNPHFKNKYASLAAVIDAIRKPLAENGLSYTQATEIRDGGFVLVTTLRHASGQWVGSEYPLPMGAKPQELGSALTYARRYSLSALVSIAADEDDDAEGARQTGQTSSAPVAKSPINPTPTKAVDPTVSAGAALVAALKTAQTGQELSQWKTDNHDALEKLKKDNAKVHDRVMANYEDKAAQFDPVAA